MVNTCIVKPPHYLQTFIRAFALREFDTGKQDLLKPVIADVEPHLAFFIKGKVEYLVPVCDGRKKKYIYFPDNENFAGIMGSQTFLKGSFVFRGKIKLFTIHFKPAGFSNIFGFPASLVTNEMPAAREILSNQLTELHEKIYHAKEMKEMTDFAEDYFLKKLLSGKIKYDHERLINAINYFHVQPKCIGVEKIAHYSNMSLKTFERKFISQIGITPKLFERISRFTTALNMKIVCPSISWTSISHSCGYYDQMHLIKDFKCFAGKPPTEFMKHTPPPVEDYTHISS